MPNPRLHARLGSRSSARVAVTAALTVLLAVSTVGSGGLGRTIEPADASARPSRISAVSARTGATPGSLTIRWKSDGQHTDYYRIETGLTIFSKTDSSLPSSGRHKHVFTVPGDRTSLTLSRKQTRQAGAPLRSAEHLYFRVFAVNRTAAGEVTRAYPYLQAAQPAPLPAVGKTPIRVASYNVRTVSPDESGRQAWVNRVPYVAKTILSRKPGIVALQELSPGPVTGKHGDTRQTESLLRALHAEGGSQYALVRSTSYVAGGVPTGNQGARIAFDKSRYELLSSCAEVSVQNGRRKPSSADCSFALPIRAGDPERERRHVAFAKFADRSTGARFWVVSAHLYPRQSTNPAEQRSQEALRGRQAQKIIDKLDHRNTEGLPVIFAGDLNSWQNSPAGYAPHNRLVDAMYYDTAAATRQIDLQYPTKNNFATRVTPTGGGYGARLDTIMIKNAKGASRFENVMARTDAHRGSDHNMVVADFKLPG